MKDVVPKVIHIVTILLKMMMWMMANEGHGDEYAATARVLLMPMLVLVLLPVLMKHLQQIIMVAVLTTVMMMWK